jgi:hypothetical protein
VSEQTPGVGRIVIAAAVPTTNNNDTGIAPAIITRVWQGGLVNVRVLCDSHDMLWWTSVRLFDSVEAYSTARSEWAQSEAGQVPGAQFNAVYWPTRA